MPVKFDAASETGVITIDNPPVNALSHAVRRGLQDSLRAALASSCKAILVHCAGRTFVAGADIKEFGKAPLEPWLPELLNEVEASPKPVVAALHGTSLGGGFELALASHYRIADPATVVGLPEVKLGLLPGAGGTQRVPRLIGVAAALDMITSGMPFDAQKAHSLGLIDEIAEGDLLAAALAYVRRLIEAGAPCRRASQIAVPKPPAGVFSDYRKQVEQRYRGQFAPRKIVDCIEAAVNLPFPEGLAFERKSFMACMASAQSAGLRHMFFAEREAARIDGLGRDVAEREIRKVAVIGGGTMGSGIAMNFANARLDVLLLEVNDKALERGLGMIDKNYRGGVKRGKISDEQARTARARITGTTRYQDLADADLVVEAVFEDLGLKQDIFEQLDGVAKPGAILATNTSYQDVNRIAAVTRRPEDVIGLHFFSPAHVMKLLEIVRAEKTANEVLATCVSLAKKIRKIPVVAGVCYGFIGNRMLQHYGREAQLCLIEGAMPDTIDMAMQQWGMAMGPMRVFDLAGLDVGYKARQGLKPEQRGDPKSFAIPDALVEMGRLGQKSGAGFYVYDELTRDYCVDAGLRQVVADQASRLGVTRRDIDASEIVDRLIYALINEGFRIVEEGIAQRPSDIDVVYVYGYGFPAYRGGPMFYADTVGLGETYARICEFHERFGTEHWQPAPLLEQLARAGKTLSEFSASRGG